MTDARDPLEAGWATRTAPPFDLMAALRRQFWLIVAVPVICILLGFAYLVVTPPQYAAGATLSVRLDDLRLEEAEAEIAMHLTDLRSEKTAAQVIDRLGIDPGPEFEIGPGRLERLAGWLRETAGIQPRIELQPTEEDRRAVVAQLLASQLVAGRVGLSDQIRVIYTSTTPDDAALIANTFATAYVEAAAEATREDVTARVDALRARGDEVRRLALEAYRDAEDARSEAVGPEAPSRAGTTELETTIARLTDALSVLEQSAAEAEVRLSFLERTDDPARLEAAAATVDGGIALLDTLRQAESRLDALRDRNAASAAAAQLEETVAEARDALERLLRLERVELERERAVVTARRESVRGELEQALVRRAQEDLPQIRIAEQQADVLRGLYADYLEEVEAAYALQGAAPVSLVSPARRPVASSTSERLVLLLSAVFGIVLAAVLAAFREWRLAERAMYDTRPIGRREMENEPFHKEDRGNRGGRRPPTKPVITPARSVKPAKPAPVQRPEKAVKDKAVERPSAADAGSAGKDSKMGAAVADWPERPGTGSHRLQ